MPPICCARRHQRRGHKGGSGDHLTPPVLASIPPRTSAVRLRHDSPLKRWRFRAGRAVRCGRLSVSRSHATGVGQHQKHRLQPSLRAQRSSSPVVTRHGAYDGSFPYLVGVMVWCRSTTRQKIFSPGSFGASDARRMHIYAARREGMCASINDRRSRLLRPVLPHRQMWKPRPLTGPSGWAMRRIYTRAAVVRRRVRPRARAGRTRDVPCALLRHKFSAHTNNKRVTGRVTWPCVVAHGGSGDVVHDAGRIGLRSAPQHTRETAVGMWTSRGRPRDVQGTVGGVWCRPRRPSFPQAIRRRLFFLADGIDVFGVAIQGSCSDG